jgi:hypothetical protein
MYHVVINYVLLIKYLSCCENKHTITLDLFFFNGIHINLIHRNHEHKALTSNYSQRYEVTSVIDDVLHFKPKTNPLTHD